MFKEYQTNELAHQDKQHDQRQSKLQLKWISEQKQTPVKHVHRNKKKGDTHSLKKRE
jgi:hypothetical protein